MSPLSRRNFLLSSMAALVAACAEDNPALRPAVTNLILGGGQYKLTVDGDTKFVLSIVDITNKDRHLSTMGFLPHGIHRNPTDFNRLAIFEKKGPNACEYDLGTRQIVRAIPQVDNQYFYGHGAYSLDGKTLFSTETELDGFNGLIGVRSSSDLAYIGEFPSYGKEPHECKLIDGGKTLVVTNGGGDTQGDAPSVAYIDINSQQLIEKVQLTRAELNTGHLAIWLLFRRHEWGLVQIAWVA
ncbi:DUF1513 domain-containing protein [Oceanicoccus sp. KOV_DT_Chl]|uniref:DUF1513 domain-containing protein n=1 Tax=Oceanicoccus sp. KOV_DT_Chl TaxID=1904639 RepID=UPI00135ACA4C